MKQERLYTYFLDLDILIEYGDRVMIWQSCEHLQAATLTESMADQLSNYLTNKEIETSHRLEGAIHAFPHIPPQLSAVNDDGYRLNHAVDDVIKRVKRLTTLPHVALSPKDWKSALAQINEALWSYLEIIEGSLVELFQQIDQIGFEQWTVDLSEAATLIKDDLSHRLDDVIWGIRRLERELGECHYRVMKRGKRFKVWHMLSSYWNTLLDRSLESTAKKCLKFLNFRYGKFVERYVGYLELYDDAEQPLRKVPQYRALAGLDIPVQEKYKKIFFLLRLWKLNFSARTLPRGETVRAVRGLASYETIFQVFKEYSSAIRLSLFDKSRLIKKQLGNLFVDQQAKLVIGEQLHGLQTELQSLATTIQQYRHFLLKTNSERQFAPLTWIGKRETRQTRALLGLIEENEQIGHQCKQFRASLEKADMGKSRLTVQMAEEITQHLHEMGQPLASRELLKRHAKAILHGLQTIEEIGSFHQRDVDYISRILCKLMRIDWKYHVLYDVTGFHEFFWIHMQIIKPADDRQHLQRYHKFKKVFQQLHQWVEARDLNGHTHDVELDINDTKAHLQDFLGQTQQIELTRAALGQVSPEIITATTKQLLEYLYLFGHFFHSLDMADPEQRQLRRRFLFADQYFDSVEVILSGN